MKKLFYMLWVDALVRYKAQPQNEGMWKFYTFIFIGFAMILNMFLIEFALNDLGILNRQILQVDTDFFPGTGLDSLLSITLTHLAPISIVNYFLIFYKKKYVYLMKTYEHKNGKIFLIYFLGSFVAIFVYVFFALLFAS